MSSQLPFTPNQSRTSNQSQPVFGQIDTQTSDTTGSRSLTGFIFNFLATPFKAVSNLTRSTPSPSKPTQTLPNSPQLTPILSSHHILKSAANNSPNQALSEFFAHKGDQPLTEIEARGVMALLQESRTPDGSVISEEEDSNRPSASKEEQPPNLPTAFTPQFRSLSRPSLRPAFPARPTPTSHTTSSLLFSSGNSLNRSEPRVPRRTFYMGPGHSIFNNSTRLSNARRKKILGTGRSLNLLSGHGYDILPPQSAPPRMDHVDVTKELELRRQEEEPQKRRKVSDSFTPQSTEEKIVSSSTHEPLFLDDDEENQSPGLSTSHPPQHQNLKLVKTTSATPLRPSPLRNVTLPSVSTPSPPRRVQQQATPPNTNKTAKRKQRSSIASSVIKSAIQTVDAKLIQNNPSIVMPSPVKQAEVINPYANLERPNRRTQPKRKAKAVAVTQEEEIDRQRRIDIHTGKSQNTDKLFEPAPMGADELLERTMPDVYRNEQDVRLKKKVGKLPDRLIKKKMAMDQKNGRSASVTQEKQEKEDKEEIEGKEGKKGKDSVKESIAPTPSQIFSFSTPITVNPILVSPNPVINKKPIEEEGLQTTQEKVKKMSRNEIPQYDQIFQEINSFKIRRSSDDNGDVDGGEEVKKVVLGFGFNEVPKFELI
ncbi:hypothetical protein DFH28DRAFT_949947 [Melampsora americana]|nr:hypothetical protein DFH28DRAFT_949947 [Melampsora americana]